MLMEDEEEQEDRFEQLENTDVLDQFKVDILISRMDPLLRLFCTMSIFLVDSGKTNLP